MAASEPARRIHATNFHEYVQQLSRQEQQRKRTPGVIRAKNGRSLQNIFSSLVSTKLPVI